VPLTALADASLSCRFSLMMWPLFELQEQLQRCTLGFKRWWSLIKLNSKDRCCVRLCVFNALLLYARCQPPVKPRSAPVRVWRAWVIDSEGRLLLMRAGRSGSFRTSTAAPCRLKSLLGASGGCQCLQLSAP
jgi:hypothetical protein